MVKNGRKVIGYEMQLVDNRQVTTAELIKEAEKTAIRQMCMILFNLNSKSLALLDFLLYVATQKYKTKVQKNNKKY